MKKTLSKTIVTGRILGCVALCVASASSEGGTTTIMAPGINVGPKTTVTYEGGIRIVQRGKPAVRLYARFVPYTKQHGVGVYRCAIDEYDHSAATDTGGYHGYDLILVRQTPSDAGTPHSYRCEFQIEADEPGYTPQGLEVGADDPYQTAVTGSDVTVVAGGKTITLPFGQTKTLYIQQAESRWVGEVNYADSITYNGSGGAVKRILEYSCKVGRCGPLNYSLTCTGNACAHLTTDAGEMDGSNKQMGVGNRINLLNKGTTNTQGVYDGVIRAVITVL